MIISIIKKLPTKLLKVRQCPKINQNIAANHGNKKQLPTQLATHRDFERTGSRTNIRLIELQ